MKKNKLFEKSLSLLVAFVMVFGVFLFFEIPQAAAETIPNVDDETKLKNAITNFNDGDTDMTIIITGDIPINTTAAALVINKAGRTLTIKSDAATPHTLTFTSIYMHNTSGNPYFQINNGTLELKDITVVGYIPTPTNAPIVTVNNGGTLIMNGGATLTENNSTANGAGVQINVGGTFIMEGGIISDNKVGESGGGGGVYVDGGVFTMNGGIISGNTSTGGGGGVNIVGGGTFTMDGGTISGNKAGAGGDFSGGGVSVMGSVSNPSTFTMTGGTISSNSTLQDGGGVYIKDSDITIDGNAIISGNTAGRDGGGIIKTATGDITIGGNARISGNKARERGGGVLIGGTDNIIIGGGAVISGNSLTNGAADNLTLLGVDNYITLGTGLGTGDNGADAPRSGMRVGVRKIPDVDETSDERVNVIVESGALRSQAQYFFADAPGYTVIYDANYEVTDDDGNTNFENVLRIVPAPKVETMSITYNANGGSGSMAPGHVITGGNYTLRANAFTKSDHEFIGWNTAANGSGTGFADGAVLERVNDNITLYAQWWSSNPIPVTPGTPEWTRKGDLTITIDADHTRFVQLVLDGSVVDDSNYTVAAGSTVLTLKESYLMTLTDSTYTFYAEFTNGIAMFVLTIDPNVPRTGDDSNTEIWVALLIISMLGIVGILVSVKHRSKT
jgi:uncharacterized repeat protein (TIGR02543 family)